MTLADFPALLGCHAGEPWSVHVIWSTVPPKDWVTARNRLKPGDLRLLLSVNRSGWHADLAPHDDSFRVQWRDSGISVESQQLRYRKLLPWPALASPADTPTLVTQLATLLDRNFVRHANLEGALAAQLLVPGFDDAALRRWLAPSADAWGVFD